MAFAEAINLCITASDQRSIGLEAQVTSCVNCTLNSIYPMKSIGLIWSSHQILRDEAYSYLEILSWWDDSLNDATDNYCLQMEAVNQQIGQQQVVVVLHSINFFSN